LKHAVLPATPSRSRWLAGLDDWMALHPWHPRVAPFLVYIFLLPVIDWGVSWNVHVYPLLYGLQCGLTAWLLWRYRRLTPELTLKLHWLAIPVGVAVTWAWIEMGRWMEATWPARFVSDEPHYLPQMHEPVRYVALGMRLLGMSILVPIFEEMFIRSLLLRSFHRPGPLLATVLQVVEDLPGIGDWLMGKPWAMEARRQREVLGQAFLATPLGALSVFGVTMSTLVFVAHHVPRDWPATVVCALAYCGLLWATRGKGLGPVIWAHGITNALLWGYSVGWNDWRFL
jgi:hypothetical protein